MRDTQRILETFYFKNKVVCFYYELYQKNSTLRDMFNLILENIWVRFHYKRGMKYSLFLLLIFCFA